MKLLKQFILSLILVGFTALSYTSYANTISTTLDDKEKSIKSKFSYSTSLYAFRGLDEFSETGIGVKLGSGYSYSEKLKASISASYTVPEDLNDSNPEYYGWEDITLGLSMPTFAKSDTIDNMSLGLGIKLPTSETSRFTTLVTAISPGTTLSKSFETPSGKLTMSYKLELNLAHYQYDSSKFESAYSPFGVSNGVSFSLVPNDVFSAAVSASWYNRMDYDDNWDLIQIFSVSAGYSFSKKINLSLAYRWKDKYYSSDSFLDDDKTSVALNLGFNF